MIQILKLIAKLIQASPQILPTSPFIQDPRIVQSFIFLKFSLFGKSYAYFKIAWLPGWEYSQNKINVKLKQCIETKQHVHLNYNEKVLKATVKSCYSLSFKSAI